MVGTPEEWETWTEACRVGVRRSLGLDFKRRRYWALGRRYGAWTVFVEEDEGSAWSCYEGGPSSHAWLMLLLHICLRSQHAIIKHEKSLSARLVSWGFRGKGHQVSHV